MERASDDQREKEGVRWERGSKCKCSWFVVNLCITGAFYSLTRRKR